jgi:hypothetical protein
MTPKTPLSLSLFPSLVYHMQLGSRVAVMLAEVEAMILRSSMASIKDAPRGTGVLQCHSCGLPHIESSGGGGLFSTSPPLLCEMVEYLNAVCLNYGGYNFPPHTSGQCTVDGTLTNAISSMGHLYEHRVVEEGCDIGLRLGLTGLRQVLVNLVSQSGVDGLRL